MKKLPSNLTTLLKHLNTPVFILIASIFSHPGWAQSTKTDSCSQFSLSITKEGGNNDSVRLLYHDCSEISGDTILLLNSLVTYTGTVKRATEAVLFTNIHNRILDGPHIIRFIVEPGPINLSFSLKNDTVRDLKITGPQSQTEKENWETVHDPHYNDSLLTNYLKADNKALKKFYLDKIDSLYNKRVAAAIVYIKAHPDSYFSGYLLNHYQRRIPLDSAQVYYTGLTNRVKQSQIGKNILSEVFALSNDMNFRKQNSDPDFFSQLEKIKSFHDLSLPDITGKQHHLSKLKGQYVVVDFWGSGCGPCFANIPYLKKLVDEMKGRQVAFVSISIDKDVERCKKAMATHHFPGLCLVDTAGLAASYYNVPWVPKYVIIKPDGTVAYGDAPQPQSGELKPLLISIINKKDFDTTFNSYHSEDINFKNDKAGITLAGTLTIPNNLGKFPAVVLISGNGEHNRNAEFSGHKPFMVIADYLTKKGIAVLRFDKRGIGLSKGNYKTATTFDFASDANAAIEYLLTRKEINKDKIGLIGHSEGGLIAPIVAGHSHNVAFIVLLAAPGIPGDELLLLQQSLIAKAKGVSESEIQKSNALNRKAFDIVKKYTNPEELQTQMTNYITEISKDDADKPQNITEEEYVKLQVTKILSPWMVNFLRYNPAESLKKVKCPVLAICGTRDLQVSPKENIDAIKKALAIDGNTEVTTIELPNLNHLFQECQTGLPNEYNKIEQSFAPIALTEISNWLKIKLK